MTVEKEPVDPEVREVIDYQQRLARGLGRESAEKARRLRRLSRKALAAIQARDRRAFANALREADVREGSPEWARAWKLFWSFPA
jgi:hypothetical protein